MTGIVDSSKGPAMSGEGDKNIKIEGQRCSEGDSTALCPDSAWQVKEDLSGGGEA